MSNRPDPAALLRQFAALPNDKQTRFLAFALEVQSGMPIDDAACQVVRVSRSEAARLGWRRRWAR